MQEVTRRLSRAESAAYLTSLGYKVAFKTLAKLACTGGGPPFVKFGHHPLYKPEDLLKWAESKTSELVMSTSQLRIAAGRRQS